VTEGSAQRTRSKNDPNAQRTKSKRGSEKVETKWKHEALEEGIKLERKQYAFRTRKSW
jgi:hypothetical protein